MGKNIQNLSKWNIYWIRIVYIRNESLEGSLGMIP